jgi:hypothetical protein
VVVVVVFVPVLVPMLMLVFVVVLVLGRRVKMAGFVVSRRRGVVVFVAAVHGDGAMKLEADDA